MNAIKSITKEVWRSLYLGFFAMLPGLMFVALLTLTASLIGIDYDSNIIPIMLFGGACGGVWMSKKMTLIVIEKMSDNATKWEIYEKVKSN
jgi:Na+-transporting NADH:ubiquinone oxidoreductase subunit NqrE